VLGHNGGAKAKRKEGPDGARPIFSLFFGDRFTRTAAPMKRK